MMMVKADVFRQVGKPWFSSYGMGEDVFFCHRCREHAIPVWVDTRVKTLHKPAFHKRWHSEDLYLETYPGILREKEPADEAEPDRSGADMEQPAAAG